MEIICPYMHHKYDYNKHNQHHIYFHSRTLKLSLMSPSLSQSQLAMVLQEFHKPNYPKASLNTSLNPTDTQKTPKAHKSSISQEYYKPSDNPCDLSSSSEPSNPQVQDVVTLERLSLITFLVMKGDIFYLKHLIETVGVTITSSDMIILYKAIEYKHLDIIRYFLHGPWFDVAFYRYEIMHQALATHHMETIQGVLEITYPHMSPLNPEMLYEAIVKGDVHVLEYFFHQMNYASSLEEGSKMFDGYLLALSCQSNQEEVTKWLIKDQKIAIDTRKNTLLIWACREGHLELIRYLRENYGANIRVHYNQCLKEIMQNGHLGILEYFYVDIQMDIDAEEGLALAIACKQGRLDIVRALVEGTFSNTSNCSPGYPRANVHAGNGRALAIAARNGHFAIVEYLIGPCGMDVCVNAGRPFTAACEKGRLDMVKYLVDVSGVSEDGQSHLIQKFGGSGLALAAQNNHFPVVRYLIEKKGVNVNVQNGAPLLRACEKGHLEMVKCLIEEHEASLYVYHDGENGHILKFVATWEYKDHKDVLEYLIQKISSNPVALRDFLREALSAACQRGPLEMVKCLVEKHGADVKGNNYESLAAAAYRGRLEVLKYLIEDKGVDIHGGEDIGLEMAVLGGNNEVVRYIMEKGRHSRYQIEAVLKKVNGNASQEVLNLVNEYNSLLRCRVM